MNDGRVFCSLFNLGFDTIEKIKLCCDFVPTKIEALCPDGSTKNVYFECVNEECILELSAKTLDPVVIFITK